MAEVKIGTVFEEFGTLWKVVNFSTGDNLWIVECCYDKTFIHYRSTEQILKNLKTP